MIRRVTVKDQEEIMSVLGTTMSDKYIPEMRAELNEVVAGLVQGYVLLDDSSRLLGYITCKKTTDTYKIETLAVAPDQQGKGIGRLLVAYLEQILLESVSPPVVINVVTEDTSDDPVQEFYKKCGYKVSGVVENEFSMGDRQVHLCKIVDYDNAHH